MDLLSARAEMSFRAAARLRPRDVVSAFAGLRPLVAPPAAPGAKPSDVSREEEIFTSPAGLVTICGGKLTTYRVMATDAVDFALVAGNPPPSWTTDVVMYQIFPDRFARSAAADDRPRWIDPADFVRKVRPFLGDN